ncbi:hypothetical protein TNCV_1226401 [Trichonephila clavipes]|nr:hypothetical protein TNCV_1226401 [Trichonephila clavipes]
MIHFSARLHSTFANHLIDLQSYGRQRNDCETNTTVANSNGARIKSSLDVQLLFKNKCMKIFDFRSNELFHIVFDNRLLLWKLLCITFLLS